MRALVLVAAVFWHVATVLAPSGLDRSRALPDSEGRDYASYHYALRAAMAGDSPYDKAALERLAQADGTRRSVHPYLYPPPFLWAVSWSAPLRLRPAFAVWFGLQELALLAAGLALWRWWGALSGAVAPALAVAGAASYAVAYGVELGQANALVLALVVAGGWLSAERPREAGVLVGMACMLKMSPALVVGWWGLQRSWTAAGWAVATGAALTVLTLPLVGLAHQWDFYTDVLPGLGAGDYNGLRVGIGMFGNHSLPNVLHQVFPSGVEDRLSPVARGLSLAILGGLLAALAWRFRHPAPPGSLAYAARFCAVLLFVLLVPVYTYAHHLIFALPAVVLAVVALDRGVLDGRWVGWLGLAAAVLAFPQPHWKTLATVCFDAGSVGWLLVQELPFLAILGLLGAMVEVSHRTFDPDSAGASTVATPSASARGRGAAS